MTPAPVHLAKNSGIQSIKADGHPLQTRRSKIGGMAREEQTVRCHGNVIEQPEAAEMRDEFHHARTKQRFAAGDAEFAHSAADEGADNAF
jgi:hypothetical protein